MAERHPEPSETSSIAAPSPLATKNYITAENKKKDREGGVVNDEPAKKSRKKD